MAEVVNSLFGITPESLMAERENALQAQAMQYAKMDPFQRATAAIYSGANRLGGAVGGLLGAQDPEMMRIQQRQQLLQGANISDPKVLRERAAAAMQQNDYAAAQQLVTRAMDIEAKQASTAKDLAAANREKQASIPSKIAESDAIASYKQVIRTLEAGEQTPEVVASIQVYKDKLAALEPADKAPAFGVEAERLAKSKYNKPFSALTSQEASVIDTELENRGLKKARAGASVFSPEMKFTNQELDWRKQYLAENKPVVDQGANVRQSLNLLDQNTPFAQAAFNNTVVSAFGGDKQKSNAEIKRLVNTGALDTRIANTITNFFEGKTTATTVEDQRNVLNAVDKALEARYNSSSKAWETRLTKAKVDPALVVPSYEEVVGSKSAAGKTTTYQGAPAKIISQNADGTVVIEQNGVRKTLAPKKQ